MFRQMFAVMNELLDEILTTYPHVSDEERLRLNEQIDQLRTVSDSLIEQWLGFEEKMSAFYEMAGGTQQPDQPAKASAGKQAKGTGGEPADAEALSESALYLTKGQGYFKLLMFEQAADAFQTAVAKAPECNLSRLFLAMSFMHLQQWDEAQKHFQLLVALTDHPRLQALGYNALGCIQAVHLQLEQAEYYFRKAHETDPGFADPLNNLKSCKEKRGHMALYFGSAELSCM
ncbi:hypothetical protein ABEV74_21250 [Paenibacillus cisolokensis]